MSEQPEPYTLTSRGEVYQIRHEQDAEGLRICIYGDGQFRFSLPHATSREEVEKFVQVYALGVADGRRMNSVAAQMREGVELAARRLGRAAGHWKAGTSREE